MYTVLVTTEPLSFDNATDDRRRYSLRQGSSLANISPPATPCQMYFVQAKRISSYEVQYAP